MDIKSVKRASLFALMVIGVFACKKDSDSTTTYKSLSGTLAVGSLPEYVNPGDEFDFESTGVTLPSTETDQSIELVFTYKPSDADVKDTTTTFHLTIPEDHLGEYKLVATAEAKGYYTKSLTLTTTVVSGKSLTGYDKTSLSQFQDARDGRRYRFMESGGKVWMADNLAYYEKDSEGAYTFGASYAQVKATDDIFGGFYSWKDAVTACPEGWRLPSVSEWDALGESAGDLMVDAKYNGARLWEFWPDVKITNRHSFYALPFGYATITDGEYSFTGFNDYAFYWADNGGEPVCKYVFVSSPKVLTWESPSETDFAAQIRCVRE